MFPLRYSANRVTCTLISRWGRQTNRFRGPASYQFLHTFSTRAAAEQSVPQDTVQKSTIPSSSSVENEACTTAIVDEMRLALDAAEHRVTECEAKVQEIQDKLLRALAENENGRQRHEKALANANNYAISKFAEAMLEVCDNLELALQHAETNPVPGNEPLLEGVKMTQSVLNNLLEKFEVTPFDALNKPFSPALHEALFEVETTDQPKGTVVHVVKKGYKIKDRVLRPARVGTAK